MPLPHHYIIGLLLLPLAGLKAQSNLGNVYLRAELSCTEIRLGDVCELVLNISAPAGSTVEATDLTPIQAADNLEIRSSLPRTETATSPELLLREEHLLTSFSPGVVLVPPLAVAYRLPDGRRDTAYSQSLTLQVNEIPVQGNEDVTPIKDIYREGFRFWDLWPLILITSAGLLLLLGWRLYRRSFSWRRAKPAEVQAPHIIALNELEQLEAEQLWQANKLDPYYTRLSDCLRHYLAGRYGIPALEQTTAETTHSLSHQVQLTDQQRYELGQLLAASDLVKFADQSLADADHQAQLDRLRLFVQHTAPKPTPDPEESSL